MAIKGSELCAIQCVKDLYARAVMCSVVHYIYLSCFTSRLQVRMYKTCNMYLLTVKVKN